MLTPVERALFDRVSVFTAPFTLEAAERVCSGEGISADDVLDVLTALVDKSLVSRIDGADRLPRYRQLETLRCFGAERLAEGDAVDGREAAVRRRHAETFTERAELAAENVQGQQSRNRVIGRRGGHHEPIAAGRRRAARCSCCSA